MKGIIQSIDAVWIKFQEANARKPSKLKLNPKDYVKLVEAVGKISNVTFFIVDIKRYRGLIIQVNPLQPEGEFHIE